MRTAQLMLDALIEVNGVPGMGAAVWRDGAVVWVGCAGLRDREAGLPVLGDTMFRLASVSKVFTTTAAALLAEQGRLDLDAPVTEKLHWLGTRWAPLTVRQLAAHASGLAHYGPADEALGKQHFPTGRSAVRWFIDRPLTAQPGTRYLYSSWGYTLIGAVIEATTGESFGTWLAGNVATGLRIAQDTGGEGTGVSRLYALDTSDARRLPGNDMSYTVPGGGLAGTPAALARFAGRLMQGQIVSQATWKMMRQPFRLDDGTTARERDFEVGLGWRVSRDEDGANIAHHAGVAEGARSALVLWPDEGVATSLMSNASWVSSIERSATMLAAPFRESVDGLQPAACPLSSTRYRGELDGAETSGVAHFQLAHGRCVGTLKPDAVLSKAFAGASAWPGGKLKLIGLDENGGLKRAGLVTPFGVYDLRTGSDGWRVRLAQQILTLDFHP